MAERSVVERPCQKQPTASAQRKQIAPEPSGCAAVLWAKSRWPGQDPACPLGLHIDQAHQEGIAVGRLLDLDRLGRPAEVS